jgi:parvulin-like peptidyl-prolyl isomerase
MKTIMKEQRPIGLVLSSLPGFLSSTRSTAGRALMTVLPVFLILLGCTRHESTTQPTPDRVIAVVGGTPIPVESFEAELGRRGSAEKQAVLDQMIRHELLLAEAQRVGFDKNPEIIEACRNLIVNRFAEKLRNQSDASPTPTLEELQTYYQAHLDHYKLPERAHIALIYLRQGPSAQADLKESMMARATAMREQALAAASTSKDFGALAGQNSDHRSSRNNGGDVGWVEKSKLHTTWPAEVTQAMFALQNPGEISPVIMAQDGIYLLKLMERQESSSLPFEQVRNRVQYQWVREREEKAEAEFYAQLKTMFPIKINTQRLSEIAPASVVAKVTPPRMPAR